MIPHGTKAVVIGNGGSVDTMPPEFWNQDCLYIGTNRALCFKALQGVRLDAVVIRDCWSSLFSTMDISRKYHFDVWQPATMYKVGPAPERNTDCDEFMRQESGWQFDRNIDKASGESAVMRNSSVVIMACNVAWHWGVRDFQLIGVDYHGGMAEMTPPFNVSTGFDNRYDSPIRVGVIKQFAKMRVAIETEGSIVNHSPGTKLKAVKESKWQILSL
ncbi:unnamed protein product [marine sediment metagenome]|uniref:DUF115 domain-containing protein n=1 Tax=marine sediment metagenome TaxID=412755 RepID=X0UDZ5_9ZZZZ